MEQRHFCQASLEYVFRLQEVHERKKFEFVETVCFPVAFMIVFLLFIYFVRKRCDEELYFILFLFTAQQLLGFMYGWLTFYHQGYEVAKEFRPYMTDLQVRLQKVSDELHPCNFNSFVSYAF